MRLWPRWVHQVQTIERLKVVQPVLEVTEGWAWALAAATYIPVSHVEAVAEPGGVSELQAPAWTHRICFLTRSPGNSHAHAIWAPGTLSSANEKYLRWIQRSKTEESHPFQPCKMFKHYFLKSWPNTDALGRYCYRRACHPQFTLHQGVKGEGRLQGRLWI